MRSRIVAIVVVLVAGASMVGYSQSGPSLQGAWRVTEVIPGAPGEAPNKQPQPSLYIFAKRHYSIVAVTGTEARTGSAAPADAAKLTDAEKIARYETWRAFAANAGTYEVTGSALTMTPIVAKNPGIMGKPGAPREFKLNGNTLTLIQKAADGQSESKVILTRVE